MSHDLRTPLNVVIGFSELLLTDSSAEALGATQQESIKMVAGAGRHLLNLVEGLLNLSSLEFGKITLNREMLDLAAIFEDMSKTYALLAGEKGIVWLRDIRVTTKIFADRHRLWEVFNNLVNNAIKFTPPTGSITLGAQESAQDVTIFVKDTGGGIAKDDLERIFLPFEQCKQPGVPKNGKGIGLGLYICQQLVELHGGKLTVQSTLGEGSCFTVTLPYTAEDKESDTPVAR